MIKIKPCKGGTACYSAPSGLIKMHDLTQGSALRSTLGFAATCLRHLLCVDLSLTPMDAEIIVSGGCAKEYSR